MVTLIILLLVLIIFILFIKPSYESFKNEKDYSIQMKVYNHMNKNRSSLMYFRNKDNTEQEYLDIFNRTNPLDELNEPLIMNRCIQFIHDPTTKRGGLDQVISELYADNKMFVSDKIQFDYTSYFNIDQKVKDEIIKLYARSNSGGHRIKQFIGPAYILFTQYPYVRDILEDCAIMPRALRHADSFSPKPVDETTPCATQANLIKEQAIRMEIYILLPMHRPEKIKSTCGKEYRIVGKNSYSTWEQLLTNMRRLLAYNTTGKEGVSVVNPRSFDDKCSIICGSKGTNAYSYVCGARNHVEKDNKAVPYISTVLGSSNFPPKDSDTKKHDYANLYLINSKRMNTVLGFDPIKGIFADCAGVSVKGISTEFDVSNRSGLDSCINPVAERRMPPQDNLVGLDKVPFNIKIETQCLDYKDKKNGLYMTECNNTNHWFSEPFKLDKEASTKLTHLFTMKGKVKWYLTKDSMNRPILVNQKPTETAFKEEINKRLSMVDITNRGTINWSTDIKYCITVDNENKVSLNKCDGSNDKVTYIPFQSNPNKCPIYMTNKQHEHIVRYTQQYVSNEEYAPFVSKIDVIPAPPPPDDQNI